MNSPRSCNRVQYNNKLSNEIITLAFIMYLSFGGGFGFENTKSFGIHYTYDHDVGI